MKLGLGSFNALQSRHRGRRPTHWLKNPDASRDLGAVAVHERYTAGSDGREPNFRRYPEIRLVGKNRTLDLFLAPTLNSVKPFDTRSDAR